MRFSATAQVRRRVAEFIQFGARPLVVLAIIFTSIAGAGGTPKPVGAQEPLSITSGDGVGLQIKTDGTVGRISVGDRTIPKLPGGGGFTMQMVGRNRNLITNGGFETDTNSDGMPDNWRVEGQGASRPVLDKTVAYKGSRSFRLRNKAVATSAEFVTDVRVGPYNHYTLSAWFKSDNLLPEAAPAVPSALRLKVEQLNQDGAVVATTHTSGYSGSADWNRHFVGFRTLGTVKHVRVSGLISGGSGTGWIDDVYMGKLLQDYVIPVRGNVVSDGAGGLKQHAELPGQKLALDAVYTGAKDHIRIDGAVTDTAAQSNLDTDKAFQLTFTLPINAIGWQWGDYARRSRTITNGVYSYDTIKLQQSSRYPYSVVYDDKSSLGMGMPLSTPRIFRSRYHTKRGLSMTFDLGVSKAASALGAKANFSIIIYTSDPAWGFRAATKKYYTMFPQYFVRRTQPQREGMWFVTADRVKLANTYKDFGLGLHMVSLGSDSNQNNSTSGTASILWDNQRNIYVGAYNHHWAYYQPRLSPDVLPRYDAVIERLTSWADASATTDAEIRRRDEARAALVSTARDFNGRLYYEAYNTRHLAYYQNLHPDVSAAMDWARAVQTYQVQKAIDLANGTGGRLDGIHLDSTSGVRRWAAVDNYYRRHWSVATVPLTYSYDSGLVTERGIFAMYEQVKRLAEFLHARGMILSANFNANEATTSGYFMADRIDSFGIETGLPERDLSARQVTVDSFALLKRTMAYQRPVSTLDSKMGDGTIPLSAVEDRIEQALFYDIYSGARGEVKTDGTEPGDTWSDEKRRVIYAKYTPTFKTLSAAGWEPVTNAVSSNPNVWLERYGYASKGNLYIALRNETSDPQNYTMTVDLNKDGLKAVAEAQAVEQLTSTTIPTSLDWTGSKATLTATIEPKTTRVIKINVTLDNTPPRVLMGVPRFHAPAKWGNSAVRVQVPWSGEAAGSRISRYTLQRSVNRGVWTKFARPLSGSSSIVVEPTPGDAVYQYRIRATDYAGNSSAWSYGPVFQATAHQETDDAVRYSGNWGTGFPAGSYGGALLYTTSEGARAFLSFTGHSIAWVAPKGPDRGRSEVWVDGVKAATVDQYTPDPRLRNTIFVRSWPTSGAHTIEIRSLGARSVASTDTRVDIDAFGVLR